MKMTMLALLAVLLALPSWADNISARPDKTNATETTTVSFTVNHAVDTITDPIRTCAGMEVIFTQASTAGVSLYAVTASDDTVSEVEASQLLGVPYTASTTVAVTINPGTQYVRFVVDTAETSGQSLAQVRCSNVIASGGGAGFRITDFGAIPDDGLSDRIAIMNAITAASEAGGGTVIWPDGDYHVGDTGAGRFYSGVQQTVSNVHHQAENLFGARLLPLFTHGGSLFSICPAFLNTPTFGQNQDCDSLPDIENVSVTGIVFVDDDPALHCLNYSAASGGCGSEETHGLWARSVLGFKAIRNKVINIGDEGFVIVSVAEDPAQILKNEFVGTPSIRAAGGSAMDVSGDNALIEGNLVRDILADPLGDGVACTGGCKNTGTAFSFSTNSASESTGHILRDNRGLRLDSYSGIALNSNNARIADIQIDSNEIEMLTTSIPCVLDNDLTVDRRCALSMAGSTGTPVARENIVVTNPDFTGGVSISTSGGVGLVKFIDGQIRGDAGQGLSLAGSPLVIDGTGVSGFDGEGIYLIGLEIDSIGTSQVSIANLTLDGNNKDSTADWAINMFGSSCGTDTVIPGGVKVENVSILGSGTALSMSGGIRFAECTRWSALNNSIDFDGSSAANGVGVSSAAQVNSNTIIESGSHGISTAVPGARITSNTVISPGSRGIFGSLLHDGVITGNIVIRPSSHGVDVTGQRAICTGNSIINDNQTFSRDLRCGTDGAGAGCAADTAAGGICDFNQICNSTDTNCAVSL